MVPSNKERLIEEMKQYGYAASCSQAIINHFSDDYAKFRIIAPEVARLGMIAVPFFKEDKECLSFFIENHGNLLETWGNLWRIDKTHFTQFLEIDKILKQSPEPSQSISELINRIAQYFCELASQFPYESE